MTLSTAQVRKRAIHLSKDLSLPAEEALTSVFGILAKRGSGKSGVLKRMAEEFYRLNLPFIIIDPIGVHWGIRMSYNGKGPSGIKVLVVGGRHGDIPLDPRAGAEVGKALAQSNVSAVIDLSQNSKTEWRQFVADFSEALIRDNQVLRHVFLEETQEYCPQTPKGKETLRSAAAVEKLVTIARNSGIGVTLASQRPAKVHKDPLSEVDHMVTGFFVSPQDKDAIKRWVEDEADKSKLKDFVDGIGKLEPREFWFWSPQKFKLFQKFRSADFSTFHPDLTHMRKLGLTKTRPKMTDVSSLMEHLGGALKKLAEEKKEQASVPELRTTVNFLRAEVERLKSKPAQTVWKEVPKSELRAVAARLRKEQQTVLHKVGLAVAKAERTLQAAEGELTRFHTEWTQRINESMRGLADARPSNSAVDWTPGDVHIIDARNLPHHRPVPQPQAPSRTDLLPHPPSTQANGKEPPNLTGPHRTLLEALRWLQSVGALQPSKVQAALWAGFRPTSGHFKNIIGQVRTAGLVDYPAPGRVALTEEGVAAAPITQSTPSIQEFRARVFAMVGGPGARLLKALIERHPESISREELAQYAGFHETSGHFKNVLGKLRSMELLDYPRPGEVVACKVLFLE